MTDRTSKTDPVATGNHDQQIIEAKIRVINMLRDLGYDETKLDLIQKTQGYKIPLLAGYYDLYIAKPEVVKEEIRSRLKSRRQESKEFDAEYKGILEKGDDDDLVNYLYDGYLSAFVSRFLETEFQEFADANLSGPDKVLYANTTITKRKPIPMRRLELDAIQP